MQILSVDSKRGIVELQVADVNDLFVLWNFIRPGDIIEGFTYRKIKFESGDSERKKIPIKLLVEKTSFHEMMEVLRVSGKILWGPEKFISVGSYHTIAIKKGMKIKIIREGGYSSEELSIIEEADILNKINPILLIAIERDEATVGILTGRNLKILGSVYQNISYKDSTNSKSLKHAFFRKILDRILEHIKSETISGIIIVGPGLIKQQFKEYLLATCRDIKAKKIPIIIDDASSGTEAGIYEALRRGTVLRVSQEHKIAVAMKDYEKFLYHLSKNDGMAYYGMDDIYKIAMWGAIAKLYILIDLINTPQANLREKVLGIIKAVRKNNGKVEILSPAHPLYKTIKNFGGIIALTRYRVFGESKK